MIELYATYGTSVAAWVFAALGALLTKYVWGLMKAGYARDALQRAWVEIEGAAREVNQTYVDALRRGREDGKLTDTEKAAAKAMALKVAKENIGKKGLAALARVLGLVDLEKWVSSKLEQAVNLQKTPAAPPAPARPLPSLPR